MKTRKSTRLAALLMVLTIMTCCFVGGTMAKYVTSAEDTDSVRIAHWGFDVAGQVAPGWLFPANSFNLFSKTYDDTVKSGNADKVMAPGTGKEATVRFRYEGSAVEGVNAPEVDYTLYIQASLTNHELLSNELTSGHRIQWYLKYQGETYDYENHVDMLNAIADLLGEGAMKRPVTQQENDQREAFTVSTSKLFKAGTLPEFLEGGEDSELTVGWKWAFEKDVENWDEDDTFTGNLAANYDYTDKMVFTISIGAEQVD